MSVETIGFSNPRLISELSRLLSAEEYRFSIKDRKINLEGSDGSTEGEIVTFSISDGMEGRKTPQELFMDLTELLNEGDVTEENGFAILGTVSSENLHCVDNCPEYPTDNPTASPTDNPTSSPTEHPTASPTEHPTSSPTDNPTSSPTEHPTAPPTASPTDSPTGSPTEHPTSSPTDNPTASPTDNPTSSPTEHPTSSPTEHPTASPTDSPTASPTEYPTSSPTEHPTASPTDNPTSSPTEHPTASPTDSPTASPTDHPTASPTDSPTSSPTEHPTSSPTEHPTASPTDNPTASPTEHPTASPTDNPTSSPTDNPTASPTEHPTSSPTDNPTSSPTEHPTSSPTEHPTASPTDNPTASPTEHPTASPTESPTECVVDFPTDSASICDRMDPYIEQTCEDGGGYCDVDSHMFHIYEPNCNDYCEQANMICTKAWWITFLSFECSDTYEMDCADTYSRLFSTIVCRCEHQLDVNLDENLPIISCSDEKCGETINSQHVAYRFTVDDSNTAVTFSTCGSTFDTFLRILTDDEFQSQVCGCDDCGECNSQATATCNLLQGSYVVVVDGHDDNGGEFQLNMECEG